MTKLNLEQKLRTGHVKRWQIVRVAREQTIAEHMYRVNLIARAICDRVPGFLSSAKLLVTEWALMHDLPEVVTGDIATPTKRAMRQAVPDSDPVKRIELSLDEEYRELYHTIKDQAPIVLDIVKMADLMEAVDFLNIEGMGSHASSVSEGLKSAIIAKIQENDDPGIITAAMSVYKEICCRDESKSTQDGTYPMTR